MKMATFRNCAIALGLPPEEWRIDPTGRLIRLAEYGVFSQFGWLIDPDLGAVHWTVIEC